MARSRKDTSTLDLLNWRPDIPVEKYDAETVRAANLKDRISRAVAQTLQDAKSENSKLERSDVARRMGEFLNESVSENVLNAYASQARGDHSMSLPRAVALMHATQDFRLLTLIADELDLAIIPKRFEFAVEEAVMVEQKEWLESQIAACRSKRK